ncbi:MAG: hypothetical protein AUK37_03665 [Rhodobacterales bacterium CG2_30_65_12]|nr:MAG: hypothetical protein AUK37_03665 [Rhodobacterales bacterium CG2_30_65_12]
MTEVQKTIEFVRLQRRHARDWRHWQRRLAAFGFAIAETKAGPMIARLPKGKVVCALPGDLLA